MPSLTLLGLEGGAHRLEADWTDPGGKIREHVDYPFNGAGGHTHYDLAKAAPAQRFSAI